MLLLIEMTHISFITFSASVEISFKNFLPIGLNVVEIFCMPLSTNPYPHTYHFLFSSFYIRSEQPI